MAGKLIPKGHGKGEGPKEKLFLIPEGHFELQAEPTGVWEGFLENEKWPKGSAFHTSLERGCIACLEKHRLKIFLQQSSISKLSSNKNKFLIFRVWFQYRVAKRKVIRSFSF